MNIIIYITVNRSFWTGTLFLENLYLNEIAQTWFNFFNVPFYMYIQWFTSILLYLS